jgi:hypothetical protein
MSKRKLGCETRVFRVLRVESRTLRVVSHWPPQAKRSFPFDVDQERAAEVLLLRIALPMPLSTRNHVGYLQSASKANSEA